MFNSHLVVHSYKYIQLPFLTDAVRVVLIKHFQAASSRFTTELLKGHGDNMGGKIIFQCLCSHKIFAFPQETFGFIHKNVCYFKKLCACSQKWLIHKTLYSPGKNCLLTKVSCSPVKVTFVPVRKTFAFIYKKFCVPQRNAHKSFFFPQMNFCIHS